MAGGTRYVRYIVIAFVALVVIFFISSSSSSRVPGTEYLQNAKDQITSHPIWNSGASGPRPGDAVPSPHALVDEAAKNPIFPATRLPLPTPGSSLSSDLQDPDTFFQPGQQLSTPNPHVGSSSSQTSLPYTAPGTRMNATFVTLARNSDIWEISHSIRQIEDRFNRFYNYDWVFLNDGDFDEPFIKITTALTSGRARYGKIDSEHWGFPDFINQEKAEKVREEMKQKKIIYGDSVSYRHMCRYESGFFFRHPLMLEYEWYWRVEPSVNVYCDISYDPFKFMAENKKKYSFVISLYEYVETIPTLWDSVKKFMKAHPEHIVEGNSMEWVSDDGGNSYNHCHFWSNFEIASLEWLRSKAYVDYFDFLDREGGFFYERWGDAPVHSIAAALMLKKEEIHFFNDIAYYHVPFTHCPTGEQTRLDLKCHCDPKENFDWNGYSCLTRYYDVNKMEKPAGYAAEQ